MAMARPPRTYDGRTTTGKPIRPATSTASSSLMAVPCAGTRMPCSRTRAPNRSRSSAMSMESTGVPHIGTPARSRSLASFNGVWPPNRTNAQLVAPLTDLRLGAIGERGDLAVGETVALGSEEHRRCHPERQRGAWKGGRRATLPSRPFAHAQGDRTFDLHDLPHLPQK